MKFFADTASLNEINFCFTNHIGDGITTNPKILKDTGDLSLGFEDACKRILERYPGVPISLETDLQGISVSDLEIKKNEIKDTLLKQAYYLASLKSNVVIKIPVCEGGLLATKELSEKHIQTNVTACMNPYQALNAAEAGATYVSLFANRIVDSHILTLSDHPLDLILTDSEWKSIVKANKAKHFEEAWKRTLNQIAYVAIELENKYPKTELIVGSIRSPEDIYRIVKAAPQIITIPTKIVREILNDATDIALLKQTPRLISPNGVINGNSIRHPMTEYTLEEFEKAADSYRKDS